MPSKAEVVMGVAVSPHLPDMGFWVFVQERVAFGKPSTAAVVTTNTRNPYLHNMGFWAFVVQVRVAFVKLSKAEVVMVNACSSLIGDAGGAREIDVLATSDMVL